jgi:putative SOS response-associated peptidase YedK
MCGRFTLTASPDALTGFFGLADVPPLEPRYNIAPTQQVFAVRPDQAGHRQGGLLKWGLIPSWANDPGIGNRMLNARSETAADKPSFRSALRKRRCLIAASGFFEWQKAGAKKQPYYVRSRDGGPLAFAGLWERWDKGEGPVESCTILTNEANGLMRPLHDRMPVILDARDFDRWLDPATQDADEVAPLLVPCPEDVLTAYPVSTWVNSPRNQGPKCVEAIGAGVPGC